MDMMRGEQHTYAEVVVGKGGGERREERREERRVRRKSVYLSSLAAMGRRRSESERAGGRAVRSQSFTYRPCPPPSGAARCSFRFVSQEGNFFLLARQAKPLTKRLAHCLPLPDLSREAMKGLTTKTIRRRRRRRVRKKRGRPDDKAPGALLRRRGATSTATDQTYCFESCWGW